ncbi:hypothetical protein [Caulobacter endophyticus]|uniref:Uncharacterized protein n=1 Tax=Caulobacter endophyticus TaxID=2172652 RepID=A0A2T9K5L7_9CAUL|nr:hypothetical protein [Caulobacter endophyticus]PVM91276.1 hypothetical protein DDF67_07260 [Caulobacter endophyticus]
MDVGKVLAIWTGILLGAAATSTVALTVWLRDPIDTPEHIAGECQVVAAIERNRLSRFDDAWAAEPMEVRRAEAVEGVPSRWRAVSDTPWKLRLIGWALDRTKPRQAVPIDCDAALDAAGVPKVVGNRMKLPVEKLHTFDRIRYSRAVFFPGGRYALISHTSCGERRRGSFDNGWDHKTDTDLWRFDGATWRPAEERSVHAIYYSPAHKFPARCFSPGYAE